jgi:hypothetical protein
LQELDDSYDVTTDYMAKARRYMPGEADADKYRYYVRDHQGSVVMMSDTEQNIERYTYDAWGEHLDTDTLPDTENKIRYGGARVEKKGDGYIQNLFLQGSAIQPRN